ncbi:bifunctional UDP-N-acetylglucosamine diphosphorylase/glucosamine-1-phosphate N-acetyltransferase GlmU [Citricoccus sp. I39-566]|uniref:bifunctional UDP-N-acetylglucosamine diphosphorylase/glucosamine-1-phosphate N-acetyltransferase GlmU n=1 Tax=Citricoccus sp. I39-566 TaxID=3073268 RepID=UPI00286D254A|nr:bifunctional UDP-N-acetylglucosamine diphosphorylase/glucosamine-1-phosphate N-acetyltransferase GlmU [Citricoccus sp. I39-566]WMY79673.1 bifunctional UDP-N-acetylglucosamine diphosphorylase/glucosamine-1-phosphate N-acetyltransferase GlmU [Citricoccus sp. I39-566]
MTESPVTPAGPTGPAAPAAVIVLAAGAGTRMKSKTPKILHQIGGASMIGHALAAAAALNPRELVAVVRHQRDLVADHILSLSESLGTTPVIADQDEVPGTGRAVQCGLEALAAAPAAGGISGTVVVTYGDVPLLTTELLAELVQTHEADSNAVTVLTALLADPTGYGRILRDTDGSVAGIVEHKDATDAQRQVNEVNSGIYAFDGAVLTTALAQVTTDNAQGEMYLTDVLQIAHAAGGRVAAVTTTDQWQVEGANDRVQLSQLGAEMNRRTIERHQRAGTTVQDPATTWIDSTVTLEPDTTILPNTHLQGSTHISEDAVIGPDTTLVDTRVGIGATVTRTQASGAVIGDRAGIGPFTYLRPGTVLGEQGKIGAFYETKNTVIGRGSKLSHLGYAGDAEIGEYTNIGCGNITANYDGVNKHRTVIGSHVRTSSNTVFIAPVSVGDGAYTGAGAVVRKDVPAGALALTVAPQRNAEGWVEDRRPGSPAAEAAAQARLGHPDTTETPDAGA